jgi:hypothetical protein
MEFIYGDKDWMLNDGQQHPRKPLPLVKHSGHHLYLDNPEGLASLVGDCIDKYCNKPVAVPSQKIKTDDEVTMGGKVGEDEDGTSTEAIQSARSESDN